jgi:hypothetical protein
MILKIASNFMKFRAVRCNYTGDKVFLILPNNKRYWVKNLETYEALGYNLGYEKNVDATEFSKYKDGGFIDLFSSNKEQSSQVSNTEYGTSNSGNKFSYRRKA